MKLYRLKPKNFISEDNDPWWIPYNCMLAIVVRADSEKRAREIAADNAGDERFNYPLKFVRKSELKERTVNPWLDENITVCEIVTCDGEEEIIMEDWCCD